MKREDIKTIFSDATDEQIDKLLDINSADIGRAKRNTEELETKLSKAENDLKTALVDAGELQKIRNEVDTLQKTIEDYKAAEEKRKSDAAAAAVHAEIVTRFDNVLGERKFAHEYIRSGVLADFERALGDIANSGKSDSEIFAQLTEDGQGVMPGLFASQNSGELNMRGVGTTPSGDDAYLADFYKNNPYFKS